MCAKKRLGNRVCYRRKLPSLGEMTKNKVMTHLSGFVFTESSTSCAVNGQASQLQGRHPSPRASPEPPDSSSNPDLPHHSHQRVQKTVLLSKDGKSFADQKLLRGGSQLCPQKQAQFLESISDRNTSLPPPSEPCTEPGPCARSRKQNVRDST